MKTGSVITALTDDLKPVKRSFSVGAQFLFWLLFSLASVFVTGWVLDLRISQQVERFLEVPFLLETGLIFLAAAVAVFSALTLGVPGEARRRTLILPLISFLTWPVLLMIKWVFFAGGSSSFLTHPTYACTTKILLMSIPSALFLFALIRRTAPLSRVWSGLFAFQGSALMSAAVFQFLCSSTHVSHFLFWHILPVGFLAMCGMFIGQNFLNWQTASIKK